MAAIQHLSTAFLRSALHPGYPAWNDAVAALASDAMAEGRAETKRDDRAAPAARSRSQGGIPDAYAAWARQVLSPPPSGDVTTPTDVAAAVWRAVTDAGSPFRILAGADAVALAARAT